MFIDEVQKIELWEKAINSFLAENIADITISGSNARLISTELATLSTGRYVEIPVYSLTFKEFLKFRKNYLDIEKEFKNYLSLKVYNDNVLNYINFLERPLLIHKVKRYDLKEKRILEFYDKFYPAEKQKEKKYIQVCYVLKDDKTYECEFRSHEKNR